MNHSGLRSHLAALLTAILACLSLLGLSTAPAWAAAGTVTEFPIPTRGTPFDITAGPDGNLWFTEEIGNAIGHISTSGSFIPGGSGIPTASSRPEGITSGPDGNLWFTEEGGGKIGRISTS
jgi:virginiamycin B lyase